MKLGRVVGHVVSTRKDDGLVGGKLLIVKYLCISDNERELVENGDFVVAVDTVGAGVGEMVIMTTGSTATKYVAGFEKFPTDVTILGIVDSAELLDY